MHGIACLLALIIFSGALGGLIFSLESYSTHTIKLPWKKDQLDSGVAGHSLIGVGGGFIAVAAGILIFQMDLEVFNQPWGDDGYTVMPSGGNQLSLISATIYVIALSVLGGYSGLRMISALSNAGVKKLEEKIKGVEDQIESLQQQGDQVVLNQQLFKADILLDNGDLQEAIDILEPHTNLVPNDPSGWLLLGYAYKRVQKLEEAIKAVTKAINLKPDRWLYHNNLACYKSLRGDPATEVVKELRKAVGLAGSNYYFLEGLRTDPDFKNVREHPDFISFLNQFDSP